MITFLANYFKLLFPIVLTPEAENPKPFIVDGKTYTWKVLR